MSSSRSLIDRHADATQKMILTAALDLLEQASLRELTVRAVAKRAGMSERTVFRYYASRDEFLDAVAVAVGQAFQLPPMPATIAELSSYPRLLYSRFEAKAGLVKSALHTEMFERLREGVGNERWQAIRTLIDAHASHRCEAERQRAAANIRYYLAATTWHYYRFYFEFTLEETIQCAQSAVKLTVNDILRG